MIAYMRVEVSCSAESNTGDHPLDSSSRKQFHLILWEQASRAYEVWKEGGGGGLGHCVKCFHPLRGQSSPRHSVGTTIPSASSLRTTVQMTMLLNCIGTSAHASYS